MANEEAWHRRHAVMLASQLPEKYEDAVLVLRAVERLVSDFLKEEEPSAEIVPLRIV